VVLGAGDGPAGQLVNWWPENLSYGTHSQDVGEDKVRDETSNCGERHGMAKLTEAEIIEIRELYNPNCHELP
jgi:hypothetical protein